MLRKLNRKIWRTNRLGLSGSKQQGLSTAYTTGSDPSRLRGIYPNERISLVVKICFWDFTGNPIVGNNVHWESDSAPSIASSLEAFSG